MASNILGAVIKHRAHVWTSHRTVKTNRPQSLVPRLPTEYNAKLNKRRYIQIHLADVKAFQSCVGLQSACECLNSGAPTHLHANEVACKYRTRIEIQIQDSNLAAAQAKNLQSRILLEYFGKHLHSRPSDVGSRKNELCGEYQHE